MNLNGLPYLNECLAQNSSEETRGDQTQLSSHNWLYNFKENALLHSASISSWRKLRIP